MVKAVHMLWIWSTPRVPKGNQVHCLKRQTGSSERSVLDKSVADAADGVEISGRAAQFFPQATHVRVHRAGVDEIVVLPDILQQLFARLHAAAALRQHGQQLEFCRGEFDAFAVTMMMGMAAVAGSRRRILQTSSPSTSGSIKSSTIKSGSEERAFFNASLPSAAVTTSKLAALRLKSINSTASGSSSTTRIF